MSLLYYKSYNNNIYYVLLTSIDVLITLIAIILYRSYLYRRPYYYSYYNIMSFLPLSTSLLL